MAVWIVMLFTIHIIPICMMIFAEMFLHHPPRREILAVSELDFAADIASGHADFDALPRKHADSRRDAPLCRTVHFAA